MKRTVDRLCNTLFVVSFALSGLARADWQETRWGMKPNEVRALVSGATDLTEQEKARLPKSGPNFLPFHGEYNSGSYHFRSYFLFDKATNGLNIVRLDLVAVDQGAALLASMKDKYGKPSREEDNTFVRNVIWNTETDQIRYTVEHYDHDNVELTYRPRITVDNKGL